MVGSIDPNGDNYSRRRFDRGSGRNTDQHHQCRDAHGRGTYNIAGKQSVGLPNRRIADDWR